MAFSNSISTLIIALEAIIFIFICLLYFRYRVAYILRLSDNWAISIWVIDQIIDLFLFRLIHLFLPFCFINLFLPGSIARHDLKFKFKNNKEK